MNKAKYLAVAALVMIVAAMFWHVTEANASFQASHGGLTEQPAIDTSFNPSNEPDVGTQTSGDAKVQMSLIHQLSDSDHPPTTCRRKCIEKDSIKFCNPDNPYDCRKVYFCVKYGWVCHYYG